jgi:hypothetical protein
MYDKAEIHLPLHISSTCISLSSSHLGIHTGICFSHNMANLKSHIQCKTRVKQNMDKSQNLY